MASFTFRNDTLKTCPYNPAHQVKAGRLHTHILKCSKQHTSLDMTICPFNAEHRVPTESFMDHIMNGCQNKTTSERFLLRDNVANIPAPAPSYSRADENVEEVWDLTPTVKKPFRLGMHVEHKECSKPPLFQTTNHMTPLEKRTHYRELFKREVPAVHDPLPSSPAGDAGTHRVNPNPVPINPRPPSTKPFLFSAGSTKQRPASTIAGLTSDMERIKVSPASGFNIDGASAVTAPPAAKPSGPRPPQSLPRFMLLANSTTSSASENDPRVNVPRLIGIGRSQMPIVRKVE